VSLSYFYFAVAWWWSVQHVKKMVNSPFPSNLGEECRKAGRTLRSFTMPEKTNQLDSIIPHDLLRRAKVTKEDGPGKETY